MAASAGLVFDFNGYTERAFYFAELEVAARARAGVGRHADRARRRSGGMGLRRKYAHRHPSEFFEIRYRERRAFISQHREPAATRGE